MRILALMILAGLWLIAGCQSESQNGTPTAAAPAETARPAADAPPAPPAAIPSDDPAEREGRGLESLLARRNFLIQTVDGQEFPDKNPDDGERSRPNISFNQWPRVSGKICNGYRGQAVVDGNTLTLEKGAATMMMCLEPELNQLERLFHQMTAKGVTVDLDGPTLTLTGDGHVLVFTLFDYVS